MRSSRPRSAPGSAVAVAGPRGAARRQGGRLRGGGGRGHGVARAARRRDGAAVLQRHRIGTVVRPSRSTAIRMIVTLRDGDRAAELRLGIVLALVVLTRLEAALAVVPGSAGRLRGRPTLRETEGRGAGLLGPSAVALVATSPPTSPCSDGHTRVGSGEVPGRSVHQLGAARAVLPGRSDRQTANLARSPLARSVRHGVRSR